MIALPLDNDVYRQMAHDIRSPLSALTMIVGSLREVPEEKKTALLGAVQRIHAISNDLLAASKAQAARRPCRVLRTLEPLLAEKRFEFGNRPDLSLELEAAGAGEDPLAEFEPEKLKRALSNLINNAADATERAGLVRVSVRGTESEVEIRVIDQGRGIPEGALPRVGRRGFTFGKEHGHGLGLHAAKLAVESFGGRLSIDSVEGVGTQVSIVLRRPRNAPAERSGTSSERSEIKAERRDRSKAGGDPQRRRRP